MENQNMLQMKADVLTIDTVPQCFIPISTRFVQQRDILPLEMLELTEEEKLEYEAEPLKFTENAYDFTCIYQGKENPEVLITLSYYLYEHALADVIGEDLSIDMTGVLKALPAQVYEYVCKVLSEDEPMNIHIFKSEDPFSCFVIHYDDIPTNEDEVQQQFPYLECRNGECKPVEFN